MIAFRDRVKVIIKIFENITGKISSKMGKCERVYPNINRITAYRFITFIFYLKIFSQ